MLKFYAIEYGYMDSWQGHFILATSPQDAADRYIKRVKAMHKGWNYESSRSEEAGIYEAELDDFGVLRNVGSEKFADKPVLKVLVPD